VGAKAIERHAKSKSELRGDNRRFVGASYTDQAIAREFEAWNGGRLNRELPILAAQAPVSNAPGRRRDIVRLRT